MLTPNKHLCLTLLCLVIVPCISSAESKYVGPIGTALYQAEQYEKRKDWVNAEKQYEKVIEQGDWYVKHAEKIRAAYEKLNMRILYSKIPMKESKTYKVKEGESLADIAKKFKTTVDLIKKSNGLKTDTIIEGMKLKVITGTFSIHVDKSRNELDLYLNQKIWKRYIVATGRKNKTPVGTFKMINKVEDPVWYKVAGVAIPPGTPENHIGTRWLGFDKPGYGIHGTVEPKLLGTQASSGCVRMLNRDVEELYTIVPLGTKVIIQN